jgi:hypothetical protein
VPFKGTVEVTYTKNGVEYLGIINDDIMIEVVAHARNHLRVQHPELNIEGVEYEGSESDYLADIISENNPQEEIQIPSKEIQLNGDTYVATFGLLEFTEQNNNQNGGRRHKSHSRRVKKTAKRRLQRNRNLKRKTHRSKRKLHRK